MRTRAGTSLRSERFIIKADLIPGGLAHKEKKTPKDFNPKKLKAGKKVEREHTTDEAIAQEIAMDHLTEDPDYYTKLKQMEAQKRRRVKKSEHADEGDEYPGGKERADRALLEYLEQHPNPEDEEIHALAEKLGIAHDEFEERAYALLAKKKGVKKAVTPSLQGSMLKGERARVVTLDEYLEKAGHGPYIGPKGGKWADPDHTIPWHEPGQGEPKLKKQHRESMQAALAMKMEHEGDANPEAHLNEMSDKEFFQAYKKHGLSYHDDAFDHGEGEKNAAPENPPGHGTEKKFSDYKESKYEPGDPDDGRKEGESMDDYIERLKKKYPAKAEGAPENKAAPEGKPEAAPEKKPEGAEKKSGIGGEAFKAGDHIQIGKHRFLVTSEPKMYAKIGGHERYAVKLKKPKGNVEFVGHVGADGSWTVQDHKGKTLIGGFGAMFGNKEDYQHKVVSPDEPTPKKNPEEVAHHPPLGKAGQHDIPEPPSGMSSAWHQAHNELDPKKVSSWDKLGKYQKHVANYIHKMHSKGMTPADHLAAAKFHREYGQKVVNKEALSSLPHKTARKVRQGMHEHIAELHERMANEPGFPDTVAEAAGKKPVKKSMEGVMTLDEYLEKAGPYIGPKGGKWADPEHKIPWKEPGGGGKPASSAEPPKSPKREPNPEAAEGLKKLSRYASRALSQVWHGGWADDSAFHFDSAKELMDHGLVTGHLNPALGRFSVHISPKGRAWANEADRQERARFGWPEEERIDFDRINAEKHKKSMRGVDALDAYLEKAQGLPQGNPGLQDGEKDGGKVEGVGKATEPHDSASGSAIAAPGVPEKKLSEDDEEVNKQLTPGKKPIETAKSMSAPQHHREMVAHESAQAVSRLRKGEADVVAGVGVAAPEKAREAPVQGMQWNQGTDALVNYSSSADEAAARLVKGEDFYLNGSPTIPMQRTGLSDRKQCQACNGFMLKSLASCPHCGAQERPMEPMVKGILPEREIPEIQGSPRPLRPARERDVYLPKGLKPTE